MEKIEVLPEWSWIKDRKLLTIANTLGCAVRIHVSRKGIITSPPDKPIIEPKDIGKGHIRSQDRSFFVHQCGFEYMKGKEVDHDWNSEEPWARVISVEDHRNTKRHNSYLVKSWVYKEKWLDELYPGKRQ